MTARQCNVDGCEEPRWVLATGRVLSRCHGHEQERSRDAMRRRRETPEGIEAIREAKRRYLATPEGREASRQAGRENMRRRRAKQLLPERLESPSSVFELLALQTSELGASTELRSPCRVRVRKRSSNSELGAIRAQTGLFPSSEQPPSSNSRQARKRSSETEFGAASEFELGNSEHCLARRQP